MNTVLGAVWTRFVQPILQRPKRVQLAALCYRQEDAGKKVLLITSRDTGRWIIPKGWPIKGTTSTETALQEAWEEAGVQDGSPAPDAVGSYVYQKGFDSGWSAPIETIVYKIAVDKLSTRFPEADERNRKWFTLTEAANVVAEPELKQLLLDFDSPAQAD